MASGTANTTISVAAPPTTATVASQILASMAALSGVLTDYNPGSQIRTMGESTGEVVEEQGIWAQALAYQALAYSAMSLFSIAPGQATPASGVTSIITGTGGSPPPASQDVPIPAGTIIQTNGGIQFQTTQAVILSEGTTTVNVPAQALIAGAAGNVASGTINDIVTGLVYPLTVTNAAAFSGGADAPTLSDSLAVFASKVQSIGLSTPVAIANAAIGVAFGSETVKYSTLYEPWIAAGSGAGSGQAGWTLFIDNGLGTASTGLIAAVNTKLLGGTTASGNSNAGGAIGYRDAGVPYSIEAVTPTIAVVAVSGTLVSGVSTTLVSGAISAAINSYFSLQFGTAAEQAILSASVANAALGSLSALVVSLYASGAGMPTPTLSPPASGRVILGSLSLFLSGGLP